MDLFHSRWAPRWLKRLFPGRWTQEEVDNINRRAAEQYEEISQYIECPTEGCDGDARYAAPGRRHREGCRYPLPPDPMDPRGDGSIRPGDPMWRVFEAAKEHGVVTGEIDEAGNVTIHKPERPDDE